MVDGSGGTQDNVKGESLRFLEHSSKQNDGLLRVCIVDGNYKWRKKADQYLSEDVWLCDHQEFQLKLQERYGVQLKEIDETNVFLASPITYVFPTNIRQTLDPRVSVVHEVNRFALLDADHHVHVSCLTIINVIHLGAIFKTRKTANF